MKKKKNSNFILGSILTGCTILFVLVGFFWTPYDTEVMNDKLKFAPVSFSHLFGCDHFGRDIFSRVMDGTGTTLTIAFFTVLIGVAAGILLGAFTGYFGGWLDEVLMRFNDAVFAFPGILLALVFISLIGPGTVNVIIALGIAFTPSFARIVRAEFLKQRSMDYVKSAKLMGVGEFRIMFVHILPNVLPVLVSSIMIGFNNAVIAEAGMSYLGIGVQPPDASLGRMLSEAQAYLYSAPGMAIFPGVVMILMILGFNLLAEGLQRK